MKANFFSRTIGATHLYALARNWNWTPFSKSWIRHWSLYSCG